jgi:uncharacterized protein
MDPADPADALVELHPGGGNAPGGAETHISVILFAGSRAYKLCKPVDVGFLDYSTRERRAEALHTELRVNRRFAPDVYLGVMDLVDGSGAVHDHALVMRRMPADRRLAALVGGPDRDHHVRQVAKAVAVIHAAAPRHADAAAAASPAAVAANWAANETAMERFVGDVLDPVTVEAVGRGYRAYLAGRAPLFEARIRAGHAVDGHGDLLADDVFCLPDGPRILDCLAFDDRLRYGDVLLDAAFLAMDLERLAGPEPAQAFLAWYDEYSGERHPTSLARHYLAYRHQVRAKVACLRHAQGDGDAAALAADHLQRCTAHLAGGRIRLVLVGGAPGTGKSTVATALGERLGWAVLRSDELRKELAGLPATADATAAVGEGLYRPEATERTYRELGRRAGVLAGLGESVVLDASWTSAADRTAIRAVAAAAGAEVIELRTEAPEHVARLRIAERRAAGGDASDATAEVAAALRAAGDAWPEATRLDTERPRCQTIEQAMAAVR